MVIVVLVEEVLEASIAEVMAKEVGVVASVEVSAAVVAKGAAVEASVEAEEVFVETTVVADFAGVFF